MWDSSHKNPNLIFNRFSIRLRRSPQVPSRWTMKSVFIFTALEDVTLATSWCWDMRGDDLLHKFKISKFPRRIVIQAIFKSLALEFSKCYSKIPYTCLKPPWIAEKISTKIKYYLPSLSKASCGKNSIRSQRKDIRRATRGKCKQVRGEWASIL